MKIKTITCHNVYNAGASLQAFALMEYLRSEGHDVEIIDYLPIYLNHYPLYGTSHPKYQKPILNFLYSMAKLPKRLIARWEERKKNFDRFTQTYLRCTTMRYNSFDALCAAPPEADVFFAGSDQIWNTIFQNGKDPAFYLRFAPCDAVRASYAASFATEKVESGWSDQVSAWIRALDHVSVRESSGLAILKEFGISGELVLDPVFLLSQARWKNLCREIPDLEEFILVYDFDRNEAIRAFAEEYAKKHGCKIYAYQNRPYAHRVFQNMGPLEFLSLIANAKFVISNSFHATAFSLIFEKPFVVINRKEKINTRMADLLSLVGLSNRLLLQNQFDEADFEPIDYSSVRTRLEERTEASKAYISAVLDTAKVHKT